MLPNTDLVHSLAVAERIRQRVSNIRLPLRVGLNVDLNYGIATYPADGKTFAFIMKMSDVRLYASKENGHSAHEPRRYPRFAVPGMTLDLSGRRRERLSAEVRDIGYGGLSFTYVGRPAPRTARGGGGPEVQLRDAPRRDETRERGAAARRAPAGGLRL